MSVAIDVNNSESEEVKSSQGSHLGILIIMTQAEQHKLQCMEAQLKKMFLFDIEIIYEVIILK